MPSTSVSYDLAKLRRTGIHEARFPPRAASAGTRGRVRGCRLHYQARSGNGATPLIEELSLFQPGRHVFFRDIADVFADQGFDFELESVLQHQLNFLLPRFFVREPGILCDLPGPLDVLLVQFDLHAGAKLAASIIQTAQSEKTRIGNSHAARFVGEIDGSLFDHAVDVIPPWIV